MNRNVNSRFATNPVNLDRPRSTFSRPQSIKFTADVGKCICFYWDEVLPGDTFKVDTSMVIRMEPLVAPIMDNIYLDYYYFFVPARLTWEHWKQFMGENTDSAWIPQASYSVPQIEPPAGGWLCGTTADYMGLPIGVDNISVSALPIRAYALVMDSWFRSENLTDPLNIPLTDSTQSGSNGTDYVNDVANGGMPFVAAKYFDYFTAALPAPQKGPDVTINLAEQAVVGNGYNLGLSDGTNLNGLASDTSQALWGVGKAYGQLSPAWSTGSGTDIPAQKGVGVPTQTQLGDHLEYSGLITAGDASVVTINQLRQAFQIQKYFERAARGGSRYIELIKAAFGVTSPDARLQRPEYLGGLRFPININQILQTSETTANSPLGDVAAYSLTSNSHRDFEQSFTEHGFVLGIAVARYDHSYQQGIERSWSRKTKFDFYDPIFQNLGEQAILNKEIYAQGSTAVNASTGKAYDDEVFGYQEAWAEYRYKPNRIAGEMRSTYTTPLDMWHLGDKYNTLPSLSDSWIREDPSNLDRALAVTSAVSHQLIFDVYVRNISTRIMPVYSIPGLIDHH